MKPRSLITIGLSAALFSSCELSQTTEPAPAPAEPVVETAAEPAPEPVESTNPEPRPEPTRGKITRMSLEQLFLMRSENKLLVIDVRLPIQYTLGHIDGAINLPLASFEKNYPKKKPQLDAAVEAGKAIVLYCDGSDCPNAHNAAIGLADRGYSCSVYPGGWEEWKASGME